LPSPRFRAVHDQRRRPIRMCCREERADAACVRAAEEHGPLEIRRVDNYTEILHQCLQRRQVRCRKPVREPHPAPVDQHHPCEGREPVQKPGVEGIAPGDLEIVDPLRPIHELDRPVSERLICKRGIPVAHVTDVRNVHNRQACTKSRSTATSTERDGEPAWAGRLSTGGAQCAPDGVLTSPQLPPPSRWCHPNECDLAARTVAAKGP
jgi:hypothetical protein